MRKKKKEKRRKRGKEEEKGKAKEKERRKKSKRKRSKKSNRTKKSKPNVWSASKRFDSSDWSWIDATIIAIVLSIFSSINFPATVHRTPFEIKKKKKTQNKPQKTEKKRKKRKEGLKETSILFNRHFQALTVHRTPFKRKKTWKIEKEGKNNRSFLRSTWLFLNQSHSYTESTIALYLRHKVSQNYLSLLYNNIKVGDIVLDEDLRKRLKKSKKNTKKKIKKKKRESRKRKQKV